MGLKSDVLPLRRVWRPVYTDGCTYNAVGYTGKTYDAKASMMDYSARWYSPSVGRFTTSDTYSGNSKLPQTLNRYAYVGNNPVNFADPTGHVSFSLSSSATTLGVGGTATLTATVSGWNSDAAYGIIIYDSGSQGTLNGGNQAWSDLLGGTNGSFSVTATSNQETTLDSYYAVLIDTVTWKYN